MLCSSTTATAGVFSAAAAAAAAGYVSRAVAAVSGAVKCWKDKLNISVYWVSRSINWTVLREKPENMFLLEERWLSTACPGSWGQRSGLCGS